MKKAILFSLAFAVIGSSSFAGTDDGKSPIILEEDAGGFQFKGITPILNSRLRYEYADFGAPGVGEANLLSLRNRFGLKTDSIAGFQFLVEGDHTWVLTKTNNYRAFPGAPPANKAIIADPDSIDLNRLQLTYTADTIDTTIIVGRQYIKFDDQRFFGSVGWRQNDQTFDAVILNNQSVEDLAITYGYFNQVNRIFGNNAPRVPLERWNGDNHIIRAEYTGLTNNTLRGFAYLLDFDNAALFSTDTYGLELQGKVDMGGVSSGKGQVGSSNSLNYLLTAAMQEDAGNNALNYQEYYLRGQVGMDHDNCSWGVGLERFTSDGAGGRFLMPLGTNHKFNGYADAFLVTPAGGLMDYYTWIGTQALGFKHTVTLHHFASDRGNISLGWEVDYVAARKLNENTSVLLKLAFLDGNGPQQDITRASVQLDYSF